MCFSSFPVCAGQPRNRRLPLQVPWFRFFCHACPQILKTCHPVSLRNQCTFTFDRSCLAYRDQDSSVSTLCRAHVLPLKLHSQILKDCVFSPVCNILGAIDHLGEHASARSVLSTSPAPKVQNALNKNTAQLFFAVTQGRRVSAWRASPTRIRRIHRRGCLRLSSNAFA